MLCPRESLIPDIKASDCNQRSRWEVLEVLTAWNCQRTPPRAYCMRLKDKDWLWLGEVCPLVQVACWIVLAKVEPALGSKDNLQFCRRHWEIS